MTVMCVEPIKVYCLKKLYEPMPEVGEKCEVVESFSSRGLLFYILAGYPENNGYLSTNFAILPDQSADQMSEEKHEALIYKR